ncbi:MAG: type II CAAX prenyl endopeptidase Rce1 family protein [Bacilli bacterium]
MANKKNKNSNKIISVIIIWILYIVWILKFSSITPTVNNFIMHLIFLIIVVLIFKKDLVLNLNELKHTRKKKISRIFLYFLGFLGIMILSNILISVITSIAGINFVQDSSSDAIAKVFNIVPFGTLFVCFLTIVFYPIVEELVFRKSLRSALKNSVLFVIVTSLLSWYFQVTLLNPNINEFILAIQTFLNSIFAGIIYVKTNNIIYTISSRMLFNIFICIMQLGYLITN